MKTYNKYLILAAFSILFFACESDDKNSIPENSGYGLMKTGNTWTYDYLMEGATASLEISYKIVEDAGEGFYQVEMLTAFGNTQELYWYSKDGVFAEESGAYPPDYIFHLIKSGANIGDKWNASEEDEELGVITRELVSVSEEVNVPAGKYPDCSLVKETFSNDSQIINYYWYSANYGIVKRQATGWADIDEDPRIYFGIEIQLKSTNF